MNAISPELALIDPELRGADIARLAAHPPVFATVAARGLAVAVSQATARPPVLVTARTPVASRTLALRAAQLALLVGLLTSGVVVARVAARDQGADRPVLQTGSATAVSTPQASASSGNKAGALERELLALIVRSPSRLPTALIDPSTGLVRDNLQAICSMASPTGYRCIVRPALHRPGEGLTVRYGPNGFTWYPYRPG